ncbi:hypothetical protein E2562_012117 [Oryza meyeriana var. granulata]|uniref:protein-serine/threonine phosphatase n=1 Tax=Oryza meyeriana var. granulata TaxID=110450 RepID=A0A6G1F7B3_9ORYZ|nr:hypothetical protein E2562_012117 [Oryza meyeriana var. granulata]
MASRGTIRPMPTCQCEMQLPKHHHVASTAIVGMLSPRHIVVANYGDLCVVLWLGKGRRRYRHW